MTTKPDDNSLLIALQRLSQLHSTPVSLERLTAYQQDLDPAQDPVLALTQRCGLKTVLIN